MADTLDEAKAAFRAAWKEQRHDFATWQLSRVSAPVRIAVGACHQHRSPPLTIQRNRRAPAPTRFPGRLGPASAVGRRSMPDPHFDAVAALKGSGNGKGSGRLCLASFARFLLEDIAHAFGLDRVHNRRAVRRAIALLARYVHCTD